MVKLRVRYVKVWYCTESFFGAYCKTKSNLNLLLSVNVDVDKNLIISKKNCAILINNTNQNKTFRLSNMTYFYLLHELSNLVHLKF